MPAIGTVAPSSSASTTRSEEETIARKHDAFDAEQVEKLVVPVERLQVDEHRPRRVRRIGDVRPTARELPDEPAVHGPEGERLLLELRATERPFELRRRKVRIGYEPGALPDEVGGELPAALGRPPVLPDDRALQRPPAVPLPDERRPRWLAIPIPARSAAAIGCVRKRFLGRAERALPDVLGIVLHPAGLGKELPDLPVAATERLQVVVDDEARDPGRPGVDREDHHRGERIRPRSRWASSDCGPGDGGRLAAGEEPAGRGGGERDADDGEDEVEDRDRPR